MSKPFNQLILWPAIMIVATSALIMTLRDGGFLDHMRLRIRSDLLTENAGLESRIKVLEKQIAQLSEQNRHLKKALVGRTFRFSILEQTMIPLAPSALGELDFFSRRIAQSLIQLHEAGSLSQIDDSILDLEVLEREMQ